MHGRGQTRYRYSVWTKWRLQNSSCPFRWLSLVFANLTFIFFDTNQIKNSSSSFLYRCYNFGNAQESQQHHSTGLLHQQDFGLSFSQRCNCMIIRLCMVAIRKMVLLVPSHYLFLSLIAWDTYYQTATSDFFFFFFLSKFLRSNIKEYHYMVVQLPAC